MPSATNVFLAMHNHIDLAGIRRIVTDDRSPAKNVKMEEAHFGRQYLLDLQNNVVPGCDTRWAVANTLHFFANTENAACLRRYNVHAERFLTDGEWKGAYGAIAMDQIKGCIRLLRRSRNSRRAIVSMGGHEDADSINSPACWSFLHFMEQQNRLHLHVYQRSLSMSVMPYDAMLLTNILNYVRYYVSLPGGQVLWTVGNLHRKSRPTEPVIGEQTILLPPIPLRNDGLCLDMLERPEWAISPFKDYLCS